MTDPAEGAPTPPPSGNLEAPPPPAASVQAPPPPAGNVGTPAPPSGNWQPPQAPASGGFQQAPIEAGPAPGISYADLVTRIIAYVIDAIVLSVVWTIVWTVVAGTLFVTSGFGMLLVAGVALGILWAGGSAVYFVYTWTTMRASLGQRILNLETVNAADGATLTQNQAIRRWAWLFGPAAAGIVLGNVLGLIGPLLSLLALGYEIYLLYTASQSTKRQGYHDVQAGTVVIKHA
jgi:uncharacterized RDD family membrane protein YckC